MAQYLLAIDQGTTSSRAIVFDKGARQVAVSQKEHRQVFPAPGWVEHDATEIWHNTRDVIAEALAAASVTASQLAAIGITNQRETTLIWDRKTGEPIHNALVWQDTRTQPLIDELTRGAGADRFRQKTGLVASSYFSASKIAWLLENVAGARARAEAGELAFGTIDSWLVWNLTGGQNGGVHITDVTNASRTMLMNLESLDWDDDLLDVFGVPRALLPKISSSSEVYGAAAGALAGVPVAGILGDQQAALFGQTAFEAGEAKNTYGTGSFVLLGTGEKIVHSKKLLTTLAYRLGDAPARYALEGSIAVTGSLVQWLRDNLGIISSSSEIEELAKTVPDNGGAYIVPAFSGLYAPHWAPDARGIIAGLTRFVNKGHLARAALEAIAYQTRDVVEAILEEDEAPLTELHVDGGAAVNDLLMQFQADQLGIPVVRGQVLETTALGAAFVAGLAVGFFGGLEELAGLWRADKRFEPSGDEARRARLYRGWVKALERSYGWVEESD